MLCNMLDNLTQESTNSVVKMLVDDFNQRMTERDALEADILEKEAKQGILDRDINKKQQNLTGLLTEIESSKKLVQEAKETIASKITVDNLLTTARLEYSTLSNKITLAKKELADITTKIQNSNTELSQLNTSCTQFMKNVALYTNDINKKRKELLSLETRQKDSYSEQMLSIQTEKENLDTERQKLAELRKSCDVKLESIKYSTKEMPAYVKGIQKQFDELGIKVPFITMLDKVLVPHKKV